MAEPAWPRQGRSFTPAGSPQSGKRPFLWQARGGAAHEPSAGETPCPGNPPAYTGRTRRSTWRRFRLTRNRGICMITEQQNSRSWTREHGFGGFRWERAGVIGGSHPGGSRAALSKRQGGGTRPLGDAPRADRNPRGSAGPRRERLPVPGVRNKANFLADGSG